MATIFVSHSSKDKGDVVGPIISRLREKGHTLWYDIDSVEYGSSIPYAISDAIAEATIFLVFHSTDYQQSEWCKREFGAMAFASISGKKILIIVNVGETHVPALFRDVLHLRFRKGSDLNALAQEIDDAISGALTPKHDTASLENVISSVFDAKRKAAYGANLIAVEQKSQTRPSLENEGMILIKPGGTFFEPCLTAILERITRHCRIKQLRVYDGPTIAKKGLFEKLYGKQAAYASGAIPLVDRDFDKIRIIYDTSEFRTYFNRDYGDHLVTPALELCRKHNVDENIITTLWDAGRDQSLFHNKGCNGLNKIGLQRSVFPVRLTIDGQERVLILLNGYIPGLRKLFVDTTAMLVAIHAVTTKDWSEIRTKVVGGESDPSACHHDSIRYQAYSGMIPLDPQYVASVGTPVVNGQRNVVHSSATVLDGFRELIDWFDYHPEQTIMGQLLAFAGIPAEEVLSQDEEVFARWSRRTRDYDYSTLLATLHFEHIKDRLRDDTLKSQWIKRLADESHVTEDVVQHTQGLRDFVENAIRLEVGGNNLYAAKILSIMPQNSGELRKQFVEVARSCAEFGPTTENEILAEALRIAASDLLLLDLPIYKGEDRTSFENSRQPSASFPFFLRAKLQAELPDHAQACARRTKRNLLLDAQALHERPVAASAEPMHKTKPWTDFLSAVSPASAPASDILGLILCGGRSTRMASTIPKAILPLRGKFLFDWARNTILEAAPSAEIYAATGFRGDIIKLALQNRRCNFIDFSSLYGVGFRVAACLEYLRQFEGPVVVTYCDMPQISSRVIKELLSIVAENKKAFGLAVSFTDMLSGHVGWKDRIIGGDVCSVTQRRHHPGHVPRLSYRDAGVYAFHNTEEFRSLLGNIRDSNVRREFMFADVVQELSASGWDVKPVMTQPAEAYSVNSSADLLRLTALPHQDARTVDQCVHDLEKYLKLTIREMRTREQLLAEIDHFAGPIAFFDQWDSAWSW